MAKVAPSILSADFSKLGEDVASVSSADYIHCDVMDGVFVPNISFGLPVVRAVRSVTDTPLDVHLMITRPVRYVEEFARAGAHIVVFHAEADEPQNNLEALRILASMGVRSGVAIKPRSPASVLEPYMGLISLALVMTVEPGFGGQSFMADMLPKIREVRDMIERSGRPCELEVDGGSDSDTARMCVEAGAVVLVAGSSVFRARDRAGKILELRG